VDPRYPGYPAYPPYPGRPQPRGYGYGY